MNLSLSETDEKYLTYVFKFSPNPYGIKKIKLVLPREPKTLNSTIDLFMSENLRGNNYDDEIKKLIEKAPTYNIEPEEVEKYIKSSKFRFPKIFPLVKNGIAERVKNKALEDLQENSIEIHKVYEDGTKELCYGNGFHVVQSEDRDKVFEYASLGLLNIRLGEHGRITARLSELGEELMKLK
ncbi:MAG: hypothetical protein DRP10_02305 [Candidatus Aenigmatarchaeota archaeon]|nr:MAG: hypothetical protein DRP10_02305 [Candidatus Aenigmarchaeota archaeon]